MSKVENVISDEAVEAAATVVLRGMDEGHHAYKIAYAALEAAAPYMQAPPRRRDPGLIPDLMAKAWDEGESAGYSQGREWPDMHPATNPYRLKA